MKNISWKTKNRGKVNREFARNFDADFGSQSFHYVNNNDVVPRVPSRAMGYSHVGEFCYFDVNGKQRADINWMDLILDRLKGSLKDYLLLDGIKDHPMKHYIEGLEKNRDGKPSKREGL